MLGTSLKTIPFKVLIFKPISKALIIRYLQLFLMEFFYLKKIFLKLRVWKILWQMFIKPINSVFKFKRYISSWKIQNIIFISLTTLIILVLFFTLILNLVKLYLLNVFNTKLNNLINMKRTYQRLSPCISTTRSYLLFNFCMLHLSSQFHFYDV